MIIKSHHKRAARYFLIGMSPSQIQKHLPQFSVAKIGSWRRDLDFKAYMLKLEAEHLEVIDKDIDHLRRAAVARLQEILDIPYTDKKNFDPYQFQWAMNKVFQITLLRDKTINVNQLLEQREGKPAETPEQKAALKALITATGDAQRYGASNKVGEA